MGNRSGLSQGQRRDVESGGGEHKKMAAEWTRVLHRVPAVLRERKKKVYDPSVASLGPYHYGRPDLRQVEDFKHQVLSLMLNDDHHQLLFRNKIQDRMAGIRHFYGGLSRDEYCDDALAQIMLHDACLLLYCIEITGILNEDYDEKEDEKLALTLRHLGMFQTSLMVCDCYKVENQLPWWVLEFVVALKYKGDREVLRSFLSFKTYGNKADLKEIPWEQDDVDQPLHLLEALGVTAQRDADEKPKRLCKHNWCNPGGAEGVLHPGKRPFRSVTDLRAKGIHVRPTSGRKIHFKSYIFFGVLYLPLLVVTRDFVTIYSNVVALELSPGKRRRDCIMASYFSLMNSMVETPRDVKVLQEKGIIVSFVDDSEEIVRMLKEMDSYGSESYQVFDKIKMKINNHCKSKANTWIAELINTRFQSPWTATALAAAAVLLGLTIVQTYFTIRPTK